MKRNAVAFSSGGSRPRVYCRSRTHRARRRPLLLLLLALHVSACAVLKDPKDEHGTTPLMRAARAGDRARVSELIDRGARLDQQVPGYGLRGFLAFLAWMQELPERDVGYTALTYAVSGGHGDIVRDLLDAGADPNPGGPGSDPLSVAVVGDRAAELVPLLLKAGARVGAPADSVSPGHDRFGHVRMAAARGDPEVLAMLLRAGGDPDARGRDGSTPLIVAVRNGHAEAVRLLLEAGADPALAGPGAWTAVQWALRQGDEAVVNLFRDTPAARDAERDLALLQAVRAGDVTSARAALAAGARHDARSETGDPVLLSAVVAGDSALVEVLLDAGASPSVARFDRSALLEAGQRGFLPIVTILLDRGASAREPGLISAVAGSGHLGVVEALDRAGADPREWGDQPLRSAAAAGSVEAMRYLVGRGASVDAADRHHRTPLGKAVASRRLAAVEFLLEAGADPGRASPESGWTPLMSAAMAGDTAMVRLLLAAGADPRVRDREGKSAADYARGAGQHHVLPLLAP